MTPESKLKAQVKGYLRSIDAHIFMPRPTEWGHNGVDFLACVRGRYVAIETKVHPRKATPRQRAFLNNVAAAGGIAIVAYEMEEVYAALGPLIERA